jgi:hypothetical protein
MPANYLTWPASDEPIFDVHTNRRTASPALLRIDEPFLWSFGELRIPTDIWNALTRYNVWIEPVLVSEWVRLMEGYAGHTVANFRPLAHAMLVWADPERDTRMARAAVERLRNTGKPVYCVWSGSRLRDDYHVDHCFPFAAWPCGDAWNLMPAAPRINGDKSNRLVTQAALERSAERITSWWADAFLDGGENARRQFFLEAGQTLPILVKEPSCDDVIDAMQTHRIRLAKDQGLRPWEPAKFVADGGRWANIPAKAELG